MRGEYSLRDEVCLDIIEISISRFGKLGETFISPRFPPVQIVDRIFTRSSSAVYSTRNSFRRIFMASSLHRRPAHVSGPFINFQLTIPANVIFKRVVKLTFSRYRARSQSFPRTESSGLSRPGSQPTNQSVSQRSGLRHPLSLDECKGDDGPERSRKLITTWGAVENRRAGGCTGSTNREQSEGG